MPSASCRLHHHGYSSFLSGDIPGGDDDDDGEDIRARFHDMLSQQCDGASNSSRLDGGQKDRESSLEPELEILNREIEEIQVLKTIIGGNHSRNFSKQIDHTALLKISYEASQNVTANPLVLNLVLTKRCMKKFLTYP